MRRIGEGAAKSMIPRAFTDCRGHCNAQVFMSTYLPNLAEFRRIFAEIPTNCAELCKFPPNSANIEQFLRSSVEFCRILRDLWGFPRKFCEILRAFLFRLVFVSTGGVPLQPYAYHTTSLSPTSQYVSTQRLMRTLEAVPAQRAAEEAPAAAARRAARC